MACLRIPRRQADKEDEFLWGGLGSYLNVSDPCSLTLGIRLGASKVLHDGLDDLRSFKNDQISYYVY